MTPDASSIVYAASHAAPVTATNPKAVYIIRRN